MTWKPFTDTERDLGTKQMSSKNSADAAKDAKTMQVHGIMNPEPHISCAFCNIDTSSFGHFIVCASTLVTGKPCQLSLSGAGKMAYPGLLWE